MQRRLTGIYLALLVVATLGLAVPLAFAVVESESQEMFFDRTSDAARFSSLASNAVLTGQTERLTSELEVYGDIFDIDVLVLDSGAEPVAAFWLAAAGFVIPYIFVYNPDLLLRDVGFVDGVLVVTSAIAAILVISAALEGHFMESMAWYLRIVLFGGGILLVTSNALYVLSGVAVIAVIAAVQMLKARSRNNLRFSAI